MTKKDLLKKGKNADVLDNATLRHGLQLSEVKFDAVTKLQRNPQNSKYFRTETSEYFRRLREDIEQRGILVPLIAKLDGTLLAGHNRLQVAEELGLKKVPVQYVLDTLLPDDEKIFVIKDNLLRRQFTYDEWAAIFREIVPDYKERLFDEARGRKGKSTKNGQVSELSSSKSLTQEIAQKTGLNERTVRRINESARKSVQQSNQTVKNQSSSKNHSSSSISIRKYGNTKSVQGKNEKNSIQETVLYAKSLVKEMDTLLLSIPPPKRSGIVIGLKKLLTKHDVS